MASSNEEERKRSILTILIISSEHTTRICLPENVKEHKHQFSAQNYAQNLRAGLTFFINSRLITFSIRPQCFIQLKPSRSTQANQMSLGLPRSLSNMGYQPWLIDCCPSFTVNYTFSMRNLHPSTLLVFS